MNPLNVFDAAGRESGRLFSDGSRVTTTYDPVGNRLVVADSTGRYTRTYDADNLTTSMTNPEGNRLTFLYDAVRRREVLIDVSGGRSTSTYNAGG